MSTTLTIDVNSSVSTPAGGSTQPQQEGYYERMLRKQEEKQTTLPASSSDFLAGRRRQFERAQEEKREIEKERQEKRALAQQKRDEDYYDRMLVRQARDEERKQKQAEAQQKRDEAWYDRDLIRQERERKTAQKAAETRQKRDEDWYDNDRLKQHREKQRHEQQQWWSNPNNVAQWMNNRRIFQAQTRGSMMAQRLGFSAGSRVTQSFSRIAAAGARLGPILGAAAIVGAALVATWQKARHELLEEANRVRNFSPALKMQEMVNRMRNMQTDMEIAAKYGNRMAEIEDIENRKQNAQRVIGVKVASAIDSLSDAIGFNWLEEKYTQLLEWMAGTNKSSEKTNEYLQKLVGLTAQQLDELGIKANQREAIATAMQNAQRVLVSIGADGLPNKVDDVVMNIKALNGIRQGDINNDPGLIPMPGWWKDQR